MATRSKAWNSLWITSKGRWSNALSPSVPLPAVQLFRDAMYSSLKDLLPADIWEYDGNAPQA